MERKDRLVVRRGSGDETSGEFASVASAKLAPSVHMHVTREQLKGSS